MNKQIMKAKDTDMLPMPDVRVDTGLYAKNSDCLAAWMLLEGAEVFGGIKPANLINLKNQPRRCGRNLYAIWKQEGGALIARSGLETAVLADRHDSLLLLLYRPAMVASLLKQPSVRRLLARAGYQDDASMDMCVKLLSERASLGVFPHEIGIFLGYPLKDVAAFMGLCRIPFSCQGPWKIYGNPAVSLDLAATFKKCRQNMALHLNSALIAVEELVLSGPGFFVSGN